MVHVRRKRSFRRHSPTNPIRVSKIPYIRKKFNNILVFWGWLCYIYYKVEKEVVKTTKNEDFIHRQ
ncbi:MAG: hypothetical protein J6S04_04380 [Clostridia bacterium]|nr:hypothetical protein [Clostridia bacterium]